ncbi:MAG: acyl-CoA desaturase [Candidatus Nanopelagicales bacterium]|nr:acyl-CoA desaturase [Candidatus Nanopelagicales bacterium]
MSLSPAVDPIDQLPPEGTPEPMQEQPLSMRITIGVFVAVPFLAVIAAIPVAWGGWLSWLDVALFVLFWAITALGITVGYHRFFTHGSFKAGRGIKLMLAIMGSYALEGSIEQWVADHRKHHKYSDVQGDPHSPWLEEPGRGSLLKGFWHSHTGWLFDKEQTPVAQYAPDIANDPDLRALTKWYPALVVGSLLLPAVLGGLITWSLAGALTAFFWAGLVRVAFVHHVTWSINSVCHIWGKHHFKSRDRSTNVWWLAIPSMGESWHSLHHAEPTAARHGALKGQVDISAVFIRTLERLHLARDVRWPKAERLERKLVDPSLAHRIRGYQPSA